MPVQDDAGGSVPGDETARSWSAVQQGRAACRALLLQALRDLGAPEPASAEAAPPRRRPRVAWLVDRHFADWPLDEPEVLDSLSSWLRTRGRCLRLVGLDFEVTARALPRFARWRRDWSHCIEVLCPADGLLPPSLRSMVTSEAAWQWLDAPDWRIRRLTHAPQIRTLEEQLADFLQRCEPAWPLTTLGL